MISAAQRWISLDFTSDAEKIVGRDESMFKNFQWLRRQKSRRHKVILWAATVLRPHSPMVAPFAMEVSPISSKSSTLCSILDDCFGPF
jgi:hypothetical protein